MKQFNLKFLAIMSLSMAGALVGTGISPALSSISQSFSDASSTMIQMVVSLPSLLVLVVAAFYTKLSNRYSMRDLCAASLLLFSVGGMAGYVANNIWVLLLTRVIVGLGYGLMMPMSVGLLSYFYSKEEQQKLNGYQVVVSSIASIVFLAFVGYLASLNWRFCFLTYAFGLPCLWLCWKYVPNETLRSPKNRFSLDLMRRIWPYALGVFCIMIAYFSLLNNCSGIAVKEGTVSQALVGVVLSLQTISSLITGLFLEKLKNLLGSNVKYLFWGCAIAGMAALCVPGSLLFLVLGLILFGIALASAVGLFNATACIVCHREESLSAMSVMSSARCLGQFTSPLVISAAAKLLHNSAVRFPYYFSLILSCVMLFVFIPVSMSGGLRESE